MLGLTYPTAATDMHAGGNVPEVSVHGHNVVTIGDFLEHGFVRVKVITRLVNVSDFYRVTNAERAAIRLFLPCNHAKQRGFTCTIRADNADNTALGQIKIEVLV